MNFRFRPKPCFRSTESEPKLAKRVCLKISFFGKTCERITNVRNQFLHENAAKILFLHKNVPHLNFDYCLAKGYSDKIAFSCAILLFWHFRFTFGFGFGFGGSLSVSVSVRPKVKKWFRSITTK